MSTLRDIFREKNITLFQSDSIDLDRFFFEPYQDNNDEISDQFDMTHIFETDPFKKKKKIQLIKSFSPFAYFLDGSRKTYKIADIVLPGKKIFPIVVAQVRAGCVRREQSGQVHKHEVKKSNMILFSSKLAEVDFCEIQVRIEKSKALSDKLGKVDVVKYNFERVKDSTPINAAIAKANSKMHDLEIDILTQLVQSRILSNDRMLIVDGPLQFIAQDDGKDSFADKFYNVIGISKSFDPHLSVSEKNQRGGPHIGAQLLELNFGERTPVFHKKNSKGREFGFWYLRIRAGRNVRNPLDGIIKIEKMALKEDKKNGLDTVIVDNISESILYERNPTCHGKDERWPNHLYPVYMAETMVKATFESDMFFVNQFQRDLY